MIYLQNMKLVRLILWPGGAYTDAYATTAVITIPYYDSFHESRLYRLIMAKPNEQKTWKYLLWFMVNSSIVNAWLLYKKTSTRQIQKKNY